MDSINHQPRMRFTTLLQVHMSEQATVASGSGMAPIRNQFLKFK